MTKWYNQMFKKPWPYWVGGSLLGIVNILLFYKTGVAWKSSLGIAYWGAGILEGLGINIEQWSYFQSSVGKLSKGNTFYYNMYTFMNIGMVAGALLATLWASELKWRKCKKSQIGYGLLGGILMGVGVRIALGCNLGAYFSAIPSFSLHGWIFAIAMFVGAGIGIKILLKYII